MTSGQTRRVLIKLSGEALGGSAGFGIEPALLDKKAAEIAALTREGVQCALVIGGGNLFRGAALQKAGLDRVVGDEMGMLATIMNGLAMQDAIRRQGVPCVLMSTYGIPSITVQYQAIMGRELLAQGNVLIAAGGTGSPFFTTDTTAVLRAIELNCHEVFKGTKVDGIYDADPVTHPEAKLYTHLTYKEALVKELQVMDLTAFALARDHHMPIRVFNLNKEGALRNAALGSNEGTLVSD